MEKRVSEKSDATSRDRDPCGSLKRFPEWEDWQTCRALETLHWCPEGTVADIYIYMCMYVYVKR